MSVLTVGCGCCAVSDTNDLQKFPKCAFPTQMTCAVFRKHVLRYKNYKACFPTHFRYKKITKLKRQYKKYLSVFPPNAPSQRYKKNKTERTPVLLLVSLRLRPCRVLTSGHVERKGTSLSMTGFSATGNNAEHECEQGSITPHTAHHTETAQHTTHST